MSEANLKKKLIQLGNLELLAKQVVEGFITGMHKSPFHGFSVEFAEHRLYNKGESTRHVDWKLFARTDKLFTKKYEEETNLRCQMILDCSSSMHFGTKEKISKLEFAIIAMVSLMEILIRQRDAIGISLYNEKLFLHTEAKSSRRHIRFLYSELEKELSLSKNSLNNKTNFIEAIHDVAELIHKRSLVLIFSDMLADPTKFNEIFQAIQHLKHNKHEVILFHVIDDEIEIKFNLENRPYSVIDMETGEKIKINPNEIKDNYRFSIEEYFKSVKEKCAAYQIDFVTVDVNQKIDEILMKYLIKRARIN